MSDDNHFGRREDDRLLVVLEQKLDTLISNQLAIKAQVEKTNGRVTMLEKFMWMCKGVIGIIVVFLLPVFFNAFNLWLENVFGK